MGSLRFLGWHRTRRRSGDRRPDDRPTPAQGSWWPVGLVVALLALSNVMSNEVLPSWAYLPWNMSMAALLVYLAVAVDGRTLHDLGVTRRHLGRGLVVGGAVAIGVLVVYATGLALPATRGLFEDERVGDVSAWGAVYQIWVRIPFGTVLLEEVAFRGVLLAMLMARWRTWRAVAVSSVLFGLWHVLPAMNIEETNPVLDETFTGERASLWAVIAAVVSTTVAGVWLSFLRLAGRHLAAPVAVHIATNSLGFLFAWWVLRLDW